MSAEQPFKLLVCKIPKEIKCATQVGGAHFFAIIKVWKKNEKQLEWYWVVGEEKAWHTLAC